MYQCKRCGGYVDAGELVGDTCVDCREAEAQQDRQQDLERQMRRRFIREQADGQLVFG